RAGVRPDGGTLGGALGASIGVRPTLWIATIGALAGVFWRLPSPHSHHARPSRKRRQRKVPRSAVSDAPHKSIPFPPMEAELVRELPEGDRWQYEPKWDGF